MHQAALLRRDRRGEGQGQGVGEVLTCRMRSALIVFPPHSPQSKAFLSRVLGPR